MAAIPQESKGISQMLEDMRSQNPIERIGRKLQLIFIKITYLIVIIKMKMLSDRKVDRIHMHVGSVREIHLSGVNHAAVTRADVENPRIRRQAVKKHHTRMQLPVNLEESCPIRG
jgi:hypothetical protein